MIYFEVVFLAWLCPGGILSGLIPPAGKPYLCAGIPKRELWTHKELAFKRVLELGPEAKAAVYECENLKCRRREVAWKTVGEVLP